MWKIYMLVLDTVYVIISHNCKPYQVQILYRTSLPGLLSCHNTLCSFKSDLNKNRNPDSLLFDDIDVSLQ